MKKFIGLAILLLLAGPSTAGAVGGLAGTPHDFSNAGMNTQPVGLCTFCHTPHRAYSTRLLWNHTLSSNTFSWSDATSTMGGTQLPANVATWTGPSKNCLSCHDGSVAIGDIAWFSEASWNGVNAINPDKHAPSTDPFNVGWQGNMSGNHPVAVPYPINNTANTYNGITTGSNVIVSDFKADPTSGGIRLFHDNAGSADAGAVAGKTGIECSSCHDPHNGPTAIGDEFLRGNMEGNDSNYICLKCHSK